MTIGKRLQVPKETLALLWDMDGVIIDSLGVDVVVCNELLKKHFGNNVQLSREYIGSIFAYDVPKFWSLIFEHLQQNAGVDISASDRSVILQEYNHLRQQHRFTILPGVDEILIDAKHKKLLNAVVSNNPTKDVEEILVRAGIVDRFDLVVGNDAQPGMLKKPFPDMYVYAAGKLQVSPACAVAIEDSLLGAESGSRAGCYTIAVATGGNTKEELSAARAAIDKVYDNFAAILDE